MIEVQSLTRHFGKTVAVEDVSFTIGDNEVVGLLGHNGAGKTTIMKMLSGYLEPSDGSINVNGVDLARNAQAVQQTLGYLPENLPVYPQMMVADYLDYIATLKGIAASQRPEAIRGALAATDLTERALDTISVLSRGFRQRVGVAQALLGNPRLLILDEPTNGLDPHQTEHMRQLIRRLARRTTIILSTHILQEVEALCHRVLMLRNGKLALNQSLSDLHKSNILLLRTNQTEQPLTPYLNQLPQVAFVNSGATDDGNLQFDIHLHPNIELETAANNIAQCVIKAGAKLYQLKASTADLDSIFREVYRDGD